MIFGLFALLIATGIWAFTGNISETVQLKGVVFANKAGENSVYCYVTMSMSKRLVEDMAVQVSPDYAPRDEYGYIYGKLQASGKSLLPKRK